MMPTSRIDAAIWAYFDGPFNGGRDQPEWLDIGNRELNRDAFEGHLH